jgi:hypothetical protein
MTLRNSSILLFALAGCGGTMSNNNPDLLSSTPATLTQLKKDVFGASCAFSACHDGKTKAGGLDLVTDPYQALVGAAAVQAGAAAKGEKRVVAGDLAASFLNTKLTLPTAIDATYGQRMPNLGSAIDPGQLAEVQSWIKDGAKNN